MHISFPFAFHATVLNQDLKKEISKSKSWIPDYPDAEQQNKVLFAASCAQRGLR